ncbi:MAG: hypothetical protein HC888_07855, partial [Candidatus Competibacteraceae bacterium]|nr:hypothetical protein [Candidatus Competibacteraceae bacterium]
QGQLQVNLEILSTPAPGPGPAPASDAPRVGLRVDTEELGSQGEAVGAKIQESARTLFGDKGFVDATDELDPVIVIVVERTGTEENPGFVVGFSIEKGEDILPGSARQTDCSLCTRTELLERIQAELPALLKLAREHQEVVPGGEDGGDGDGGEGGDEGGATQDVKPIGPLGFAGVGVGVGVGRQGVEPANDNRIDLEDYRTPGNVVLAIGGAALIAGVVMIAVDVSKRKKARKRSARIEPRAAGFAF